MEVLLAHYCGAEDVITPIAPPHEGHSPRNYQGYWNVLPELLSDTPVPKKKIWDDFRNRDRFYNHISAAEIIHRIPRRVWNSYYKFCFDREPYDKQVSYYFWRKKAKQANWTFEEFLAQRDFCINTTQYMIGDRLVVDFVGKYERMKDDLQRVFDEIGVAWDGSLPFAKAGIRDSKRPLSEFYNENTKALVREAFQKEFEINGYDPNPF